MKWRRDVIISLSSVYLAPQYQGSHSSIRVLLAELD